MASRIARLASISLVAIIVLAIALVFSLDFGRFKGRIEAAVSESLGREFLIDGPLHATVGGSIEVLAGDIRLAASDWSAEPRLVEIGSIEVSIDTWSLFSGPIVIERLVVERVRANLETNPSGEANWTFVSSDEMPEQESPGMDRLPAIADDVSISDVIVNYRSPDREVPRQLVVSQFDGNQIEDRFELAADGRVNETAFDLSLTAGTVAELIEFGSIDTRLAGQLGEIDLRLAASVSNLLSPERPEIEISLTGPNADYLLDSLGIDRFTTGPLRLEASVKPGEDAMAVAVGGEFGEFDVSAEGRFVNLRELDQAALSFTTSGPDFGRLAGMMGVDHLPNDPFTVRGDISRSGPTLIIDDLTVDVGETRFDLNANVARFPNTGGASAQISLTGPDIGRFNRLLGLPGRLNGPFRMDIAVVPRATGGADVELRANTGNVTYSVDGMLTDDESLVGSNLRFDFEAPDLRVLADAFGIDDMPDRRLTGGVFVERAATGFRLQDGRLAIDGDSLVFDGEVADAVMSDRTRVGFTLHSADVAATLSMFGIEHDRIMADELQVTGVVMGNAAGLAMEGLELAWAGVEATLDARISMPDVFDDSDLQVRVIGNDFSRWLPSSDAVNTPSEPFELAGAVRTESGQVRVSNLDFSAGATRMAADAAFDRAMTRASVTVNASTPDLNVLSRVLANQNRLDAVPFALEGTVVWADELLTIDALHANVGEGTLDVSGSIAGPPDFDSTDLQLKLDVADLRNLSVILGRELPEQRAQLVARLVGDDNVIRLDQFDGTFGESDLQGEFELRYGDTPEFALSLTSNRLDLTPYLPPIETATLESPGTVSATPAVTNDARVIPDEPLPIDVLKNVTAEVRLGIGELIARQHHYLDVSLAAVVRAGNLEVEDIRLRNADGGRLEGRIVVEPGEKGSLVGARIYGSDLKMGLPATTPQEYEALPSYDLNLAFISTGRTTRELAAAVNGYLKLTSGEGRVRAGALRIFTNDFLVELLNTVNPFAGQDPYSQLNCAAVLATVEQGKVLGEPVLVVQSDRLNIFANTRIDLATETLDADFNTVPMKGLGISLSNLVNPYVKVGGTLANPTLGLDAESTLIEGGAAVATGGISILAKGLKDRFFSDKDPCGTAVAAAEEQFRALEEKYARRPEQGN